VAARGRAVVAGVRGLLGLTRRIAERLDHDDDEADDGEGDPAGDPGRDRDGKDLAGQEHQTETEGEDPEPDLEAGREDGFPWERIGSAHDGAYCSIADSAVTTRAGVPVSTHDPDGGRWPQKT
jgi:hypothetical protein